MGRGLANLMRRKLPPPFSRATRVLKSELFERPLWYDIVKYAPPIAHDGHRRPQKARPKSLPRAVEAKLYSRLLKARPMLRLEPLNALSNAPSLGYRFVTTQLMLMRNDNLPETQAFATAMASLSGELDAFEDSLHATAGLSKFRVSKERVLRNLTHMFQAAGVANPAAAAARTAQQHTAAGAAGAAGAAPAAAGAGAGASVSAAAAARDLSRLVQPKAGGAAGSIHDTVKPKRAPAMQSEPLRTMPQRAVARPVYYDETGRMVRAPESAVEIAWAAGTEVYPVIAPVSAAAGLELQLPADLQIDATDNESDATDSDAKALSSSEDSDDADAAEADAKEPAAAAEDFDSDGGHVSPEELREDRLQDRWEADMKSGLMTERELADFEDEAEELYEEWKAKAPLRKAERKRLREQHALVVQRATDIDAAYNAKVTAIDESAAAVDDFSLTDSTTRAELDAYLDDKVQRALPLGTAADKLTLRHELEFNVKLKRSMLMFEVLRQALLSNDERKIDVAIRSTYDDIFGFASPLQAEEVMESVVYELTRQSAGGNAAFVDPKLGKKRIDLRALLRRAHEVRVAQDLLLGPGSGAAATAATGAAAAPAAVTLASTLDALAAPAAAGAGGAGAGAGAREGADSKSVAAAARAATIDSIKQQLSSLRSYGDKRYELSTYLAAQLQRAHDEARGKKPRSNYREEVRPIMTLPRWRALLLSEMDVAQRVMGMSSVPSYGTGEAERAQAAAGSNRFGAGDSATSRMFAHLPTAADPNALNAMARGTSGSAAAVNSRTGKPALPSIQTTGRHGNVALLTPRQFRKLARPALKFQLEGEDGAAAFDRAGAGADQAQGRPRKPRQPQRAAAN